MVLWPGEPLQKDGCWNHEEQGMVWVFLWYVAFICWIVISSPLAFYVPAESLPVEKALPDLQLLLCSEDRRPYCHVCILLCCFASYRLGSWSIGTKMGCRLYSFYDHPPKCSRNTKVIFLPVRTRNQESRDILSNLLELEVLAFSPPVDEYKKLYTDTYRFDWQSWIADHSTWSFSGSFSRMSCRCTEQRQHSSVCWKQGE